MKIIVKQIHCEGKNEFDIQYNNQLQYKAKLPYISIHEPLNLEKLRKMKIYDLNNNEVYTTNYKYIENFKEELIPLKYLVTGSQKFNQLIFQSDANEIKIYYESNGLMNNRYVIDINGKQYYAYSIEDGYIRHFPIYDQDIQVAEILKSNIVTDGLDEYHAYIKDGYECLSDGIMNLVLFLDRSEYSSSYIVNKSTTLEKKYSYSKNTKFYDKNWVKTNFGDDFYHLVDQQVRIAKEELKHPIQTSKKQWSSLPKKKKKILIYIIVAPWVLCLLIALMVGIIFLMNK